MVFSRECLVLLVLAAQVLVLLLPGVWQKKPSAVLPTRVVEPEIEYDPFADISNSFEGYKPVKCPLLQDTTLYPDLTTLAKSTGKRHQEQWVYDMPCIKALGESGCNTTFVFVLVPPYSGSTSLYGLLATSENSTSLLSSDQKTWAGESHHVYYPKLRSSNPDMEWKTRWLEEDKYFNGDAVADVLIKEWKKIKSDAPVYLEKTPPHLIRAHELYHAFKRRGKVRFVLMLHTPCRTHSKEKYMTYAEHGLLILAQYGPITQYLRQEDLLLHVDESTKLLREFLPDLSDIDPRKKPPGSYGKRSESIMDYVKTSESIGRNGDGGLYLKPRHPSYTVNDVLTYKMLSSLGLLHHP